VCAELYELPERLDGDFDVVYTSRGVLGWLPDIPRWAGIVARFLRPGGIFYITEIHPVMLAFDDRPGVTDLRLHFPYWSRPEPIATPSRGSHADRAARVAQPLEYTWVHDLGEIVTALASAGLRIDFLRERPFLEWEVPFLTERERGRWRLPEGQELPL
jgi:SAM-dependent methyltransferase